MLQLFQCENQVGLKVVAGYLVFCYCNPFFLRLLSTRFLRRLAARMAVSEYLSVQGRLWFDDASRVGPQTQDAASDWHDSSRST